MDIENKIIMDIEPISRRVFADKNKVIYEILKNMGIQIRSLCGGRGTCGKCKVLFKKGANYLNNILESEKIFFTKEELSEGWRLASNVRIIGDKIGSIVKNKSPDIRLYLPDELLVEDFDILTSGKEREIILNPSIRKKYIEIDSQIQINSITDVECFTRLKIKDNLSSFGNEPFNIDPHISNNLLDILSSKPSEVTLTYRQDNSTNLINYESGNTVDNNFGIAIDIGTTTVVGYLTNLNNGKLYSVASALNPQTAYGEDVISRLKYIKDNEFGLQELNKKIIDCLNKLVIKTCSEVGINPAQVYEASVVGNSIMHHIFLGINPLSLGISPYLPVVKQALNTRPDSLNLKINPHGNVYTLPLISGFVGADTMGVILSSNIEEENDLTLVIDIGTNGEIIIGNKNLIITGSCAAGSALEGAHIVHGMRASAGAINSIIINPVSYEVEYSTIQNKKPIGICGSGLIDLTAEMLKAKIILQNGNFNKELIDCELFNINDNNVEYIVVRKEKTSLGRAITLSQDDIRQIQMAKGAFYSGTRIMLKSLNIDEDIKQIFLAGAFGNYIDKNNTKFIGMIPDISSEKIFQIGNAAGMGAQYCLKNKELRKNAIKLLQKITYIEIANIKEFQREYAEAMYFPNRNLNLFPSLKEYTKIPKKN